MATDTLPESVGFLTDAAHLLMKSAPETSAYIMSQRNSLMFHNDLEQSGMQRQHVCGACGHIMIPGQGSELKIDTNKTIWKRKNSRSNGTSKRTNEKTVRTAGCRKRFTCEMCHRYTDISIPPPAPISRRRQLKSSKPLVLGAPASIVSATSISEPGKVSANANSKKRAKSRKQGLQALLQQAQSSASKPQNGLGLSLSDFMMK
ncbi:uncharacterized protein F4822DRAFT_265444 [Hypoxylon trugodes]|uniref:uncharacterized protein n=1 Tax=Hypoxylon trugodes TaxID=326681 RepID=UPI002193EBFC|nr:uncharacterized protein F4822DRAFT_265444 [Hypoxylon trugodes]KAI1388995.1 hypothetical protein F4822DRAFT_265444 [Hypoxylon trugodes]